MTVSRLQKGISASAVQGTTVAKGRTRVRPLDVDVTHQDHLHIGDKTSNAGSNASVLATPSLGLSALAGAARLTPSESRERMVMA